MCINLLLGYLIRVIHILVVLFVLLGVLLKDNLLILLHLVTCIGIIVHWITNNQLCCLTVLESILLKKPISETFLNKIFEPIYKIPTGNFKPMRVIMIIIIAISCFKLINNIFFVNKKYD